MPYARPGDGMKESCTGVRSGSWGMKNLATQTWKGPVTMSGVMSFLRMTMETELDFKDRRLPTLDVKLWVTEDNKVMYTYFEK